ncbi:hypothetical protein ACHQM5_004293 [Ranunculus cassubicifolius]
MFFNRLNLMKIFTAILRKLTNCFGYFRIKDDPTASTPLLSDESCAISIVRIRSKTLLISSSIDANLLKACGAITETIDENCEISEKLDWEEQSASSPNTATRHNETVTTEPESPEHTPCRTLFSEELQAAGEEHCQNENPSIDINTLAVTPMVPSLTSCRNKSVRFEVEAGTEPLSSRSFLYETSAKYSEQSNSFSSSEKSSYATPLSVTDDMETPGTIYLSTQTNLGSGKHTRIRSQYVRSILKPIDNFPHVRRSLKVHKKASPDHYSVSRAMFGGRLHSRINAMDMPILGVQWNCDEPSPISDKLLIANGIPNSTRKYKEDQKISWHATPFEERVEKAISEEARIAQRKLFRGRPIEFDEIEECEDTSNSAKSS